MAEHLTNTQYVNVILKITNRHAPREIRHEIIWKVIEDNVAANSYLEYLNTHECESDDIYYRIEQWKVSRR